MRLLHLDNTLCLFIAKVFFHVNGKMVCIYIDLFLSWWPLKALYITVLPFTHSHTHTHLCIALFFYEGPFVVKYLAQGHFGFMMGKTGIEPLTFWLEENRSTPQPQPPLYGLMCQNLLMMHLWFLLNSIFPKKISAYKSRGRKRAAAFSNSKL